MLQQITSRVLKESNFKYFIPITINFNLLYMFFFLKKKSLNIFPVFQKLKHNTLLKSSEIRSQLLIVQ
jgi:hypothetical protein